MPSLAILNTVIVAQLVRASVCGTEGRGFESHLSPQKESSYDDSFFLHFNC